MATRQAAAVLLTDSRRKSARLKRTVNVIAQLKVKAPSFPAPTELDCMENDYYRFQHRPRD
jgi:hypothetical protein